MFEALEMRIAPTSIVSIQPPAIVIPDTTIKDLELSSAQGYYDSTLSYETTIPIPQFVIDTTEEMARESEYGYGLNNISSTPVGFW